MMEYPLEPRHVAWERAGITPMDFPTLMLGWGWAADKYYRWLENPAGRRDELRQVASILKGLQEIGTLEDLIRDFRSKERAAELGAGPGVMDMAYASDRKSLRWEYPPTWLSTSS